LSLPVEGSLGPRRRCVDSIMKLVRLLLRVLANSKAGNVAVSRYLSEQFVVAGQGLCEALFVSAVSSEQFSDKLAVTMYSLLKQVNTP
jgi:hypothetical protein